MLQTIEVVNNILVPLLALLCESSTPAAVTLSIWVTLSHSPTCHPTWLTTWLAVVITFRHERLSQPPCSTNHMSSTVWLMQVLVPLIAYVGAPASGAHFNPIITFSFMITGIQVMTALPRLTLTHQLEKSLRVVNITTDAASMVCIVLSLTLHIQMSAHMLIVPAFYQLSQTCLGCMCRK